MHPLVSLAKSAVENYIKERKIISPSQEFPKKFLEKRTGTFVTIEQNGKLRGCIGTYLPIRKNIAEEVIYNAIAAATEDYRFMPIKENELSSLNYTVYVLDKPKLIKDLKELNPKKFGIVVKTMPFYPNEKEVVFNGHIIPKTGLLLPNLDGIKTIQQQLLIACQKGGIDPTKEKILVYKFTAKKYKN